MYRIPSPLHPQTALGTVSHSYTRPFDPTCKELISKHTHWIVMLQFTKDTTALSVSELLSKNRKTIDNTEIVTVLFCSNKTWLFWSINFLHCIRVLNVNRALAILHQILTKPWQTNTQEIGKDLATSVSNADKAILLAVPSHLRPLCTNCFSWTPISDCFLPQLSRQGSRL